MGRNQNCRFVGSQIGTTESSYITDTTYGNVLGNEAWLEQMVGTIGPISTTIYASANFIRYKSGK